MKITLQFTNKDYESYDSLLKSLKKQLSSLSIDYYLLTSHFCLYFNHKLITDKDKTLSVRKHNIGAVFNLPKELWELLFSPDAIVKNTVKDSVKNTSVWSNWEKTKQRKLSFEVSSY